MPRKILGMSGSYSGISAISGNSGSGGEEEVPDLTPPSATTNLVVTPTLTPSVQLTWDAATDNVSIAGYIVERRSIFKHDDIFEADGYGGVYVIAKQPSALTSDTTSTGRDFGPVYSGVRNYATQMIGSVSGTNPTMTTKIQESNDLASWTDISGAVFTQITSTDNSNNKTETIEFVRTKRYLRTNHDISGVTPSVLVCAILGEEAPAFVELVDDITALDYEDTSVEEDITYEYRVNAKDPTNNRGAYTNTEQVYVAPMSDIQMTWGLAGALSTSYTPSSVQLTFTGIQDHHVGRTPSIYREDTNGTGLTTAGNTFTTTDDHEFVDDGDGDESVVPLNPELNTNWFFRFVDGFGNLGVASPKIGRHAMIQSTPSSSGTFARPSGSLLVLLGAGGKGMDGVNDDGGNSGQAGYVIKMSPSIPLSLSWAIDGTKSNIVNGMTTIVEAFHGVASEVGTPIGDVTYGQNPGESGANNGGGGGAAGPNGTNDVDPPLPGAGDSGGLGGFSYQWPGGNGGAGGDNTANGNAGQNYMSGGGGFGATGSTAGAGGAAICFALYYRNEAVTI